MVLNIGNNIKVRREERYWSQLDLAKRVNVNNTMICQIERGTKLPTVLLLKAIAEELNCTMDDLVK